MNALKRIEKGLMKRLIIITLLAALHISLCFSQTKKIDSLLAVYSKCKIDTCKIDILLAVSAFYRDAEPEKTISYGMIALKLAQKIDDDKREAEVLDLIGQGYEQIGDIAKAISNFNESFRIASNIHDIEALARIKLNLGGCYTDVGNFPLAVDYNKEAVKYFSMLNQSVNLCRAEVFLSDALFKSGNPDSAIFYLDKAIVLSKSNNNYLLDYILTNYAESYYLKKQFSLSKEYIGKAMTLSIQINDQYAIAAEYLVLAKIYLSLNDLSNAELYVKKGLAVAEETKIRENLIDAYNILSKILEKKGNYAEALKFKNLFIVTNDSIQSATNNDIVQTFENNRSKQDLAVLKAEKRRKESELKRQELVSDIIFGTLLLVSAFAGFVFYSRNKLKQTNAKLQLANEEINKKQQEILCQNEALVANNLQIKKQSEDIEELNNLKDRLLAIISHDLRSPLKNLKAILGLLAAGNLSQEKFQTIIPALVKGVTTTLELVENLLFWSNAQLKGTHIVRKNFELYPLVQTQLQLFEKQASDKQIELLNEISPDMVVHADKNMIDLVLRNLVANAIKYCDQNKKVILSAKQLDNKIEINVTDNGMGISEENIQKVFKKKERFTTLGTNRESGTGLGLILCKDFVEKNNGTIGVESKEGEGARFWFTLPAKIS